jgi:hypothetical protein
MDVWGLMDRYSGVDIELLTFGNVLHNIWHIQAIPTYGVQLEALRNSLNE